MIKIRVHNDHKSDLQITTERGNNNNFSNSFFGPVSNIMNHSQKRSVSKDK